MSEARPGISSGVPGKPKVSSAEAERLAAQYWGVVGVATPLPGERDENFRLDTPSSGSFVLKAFHPLEEPAFVAAQAALFRALAKLPRRVFPSLLPTSIGENVALAPSDSAASGSLLWLMPLLSGVPVASVPGTLPGALLRDVGCTLGLLSSVLAANPQPAAEREFAWAPHTAPAVIRAYQHALNPERQAIVHTADTGYEERVVPSGSSLRWCLIHNDVNDHNLLVEGERVTGIIDFGDMVVSYLPCELAHALTYLLLDRPDPLRTARALARGYQASYPLTEAELMSVYDLVRLRLALSVTLSAHQQKLRPEDPYLSVSEAPAWRLLEQLVAGEPSRDEFTEALLEGAREGSAREEE